MAPTPVVNRFWIFESAWLTSDSMVVHTPEITEVISFQMIVTVLLIVFHAPDRTLSTRLMAERRPS